MCASSTHTMFDVQNIYGTPQVPRKRTCIRPRRMTLIDLRNVPLAEEDAPHRKGSAGTIRSEGGLSHYSKSGIWHIHDSTDSLPSWRGSTMRTKHSSSGSVDGPSRFPKLEECAHFHYDLVDFGPLQAALCEDDRENFRHNEDDTGEYAVLVRVCCNNKAWTVRRTLSHFCSLDRQLHRCIFDRKFSQLPELHGANIDNKTSQEMEYLLHGYLRRFSELAGSMINCGSILNWLEMDNRGNRLLAVDDSGINTPAIAAAHAVKRYNAQAADEISLQVGDIVSVIDMPPAEDTIWWRGKRGFEVGFFPSECVEVIGDKVPPSMATRIASSASGTGQATLPPSATLAAARKPCEIEPSIDTAVMMRKHGKLLSFLRTFFTTRPARNQLKQSGIVKERVFGCDLGEHLLNSGHDVPLVLKSCTEVIERHGIVDGIYRLSGITSNIQKLRVAFDEDPVPELMDSAYLQDIHSISSLLKMYFRELPNPLLTYQLYDKFAEAVKDEDNKLLRIHDVVQQLPPPHYRTLEYLMRHLARVASHGHETGMHSKNLAIVWAPNLLRSKELEQGGGAAALQGVGIQAVVTECLICYSDILFSDKLPNYSSPHLQKSQKKPRPKSLAISTPTRLLSLEEARERAFIGSLAQSQRYIDVGGGPASLPSTYHTVIDLPGYRKKTGKETNKGKKSPVTGWKSIFSKPRSGSMKKSRKPSIHGTDIPDSSVQAKALTEEDVHNWKRRLRSAKSAESLLSMATSSRSSNGSHGLNFISTPDGSFRFKDEHLSPYHKRSLSSDASAIIHHHHLQRDLQNNLMKEASVDVKNDNTSLDGCTDSDKQPESSSRQTFIRGDSTRKALHRRTPSAPNTPRLDRDHGGMARHAQKTSSQPGLDSLPGSPSSDNSMFSSPTTDGGLGIDIDAAIKARLQQMAVHSCRTGSGDISPLSVSKLSPNRGEENIRKGETETGTLTVELPASPGSLRRHPDTTPSMSKFFVSRYHDYAEILSDDEKDANDSSEPSSTADMQELVEKLDSKLQSTVKFYLHSSGETDSQQSNTKLNEIGVKEVHTQVSSRNVEHLSANKHHRVSPPGTLIPHRRRECIPSDTASAGTSQQGEDAHSALDFAELAGWVPRQRNSIVSPASHPSEGHSVPEGSFKHRQGSSIISGVGGNITKCLSVPSDIARSLENITASQCDLLSSVTISELSQSINSFCTSLQDDSPAREDSRWRRSTSLDSLENDSPMCRTLRAINAQMNSAFHQTDDSALTPDNEHYSEHAQESSLTPLHISEERLTPSKLQETHFPATLDTDTSMQERSGFDSSVVQLSQPHGKFIHPCPNSDTEDEHEIVSHQFASGTPLHVAQCSKEQLSPQTAMLLSSSHYKGVEKSVSEDVRSQEQFLTSSVLQHEKTNSDRLTFLHSPSSSSSCSTGSSNSDEDSDGSFEIVHHAQPHDVQYAMRLRSGQRAAESLPNIMRSTGATCSVPVMKPSTTVQPLQYSECSSELPKFSQDDYLWKQSPLFGSKEKAIDSEIKSSDKENHERKYWKYKKRPLSMSLSSNNSIRNQWERPILNGNQASPSHQESKELDPGTTAGQEFQSFSQSQQNRDLVSPNQSFRPSPHGRTSDETESKLTPQLPSPSLPLHLMLYHPDEFQVPKSAFGMVSTPPPPEVHVNSDTVTEEKAIIKKTSFKKSPTETEISAHCSRHASQPQTSWQSLPRNASFTGNGVVPVSITDQSSELGRISVDLMSQFSEFIEGQDTSNKVIDMGGGWGTSSQAIEVERGKGMELGQSEIDAMEVDNLCNKLVDDLTQIHDSQQSTVHSRAQGEGPCAVHLSTLQIDAVMKQQFEGSGSGSGDASLMQKRIQRLNSFGEVQEEELQNALNAGKELLLAREPSAPIIISSSVISPTTSGCSQSHKPTHERKLSASKIPRFNKWIDYKEEKVSSADSTQSSGINSIASNVPNPCFIAEVKTAVVQSKSKDSEQSKFRSSKIPLSQKIPSPTSSFHEPQQRFLKTDSSPSSHKHSFPVAHKTLQQTKSSHGPGPVPKARISLNKPDVAPPAEEVVEVTRPSVRKRASLSKGDKSVTKEDKTVIVKELKIDKGEAKLVIEKQPHLKKKIQTVHARKVPHPPRQIAEALDADSCDSPSAEHSSTGPSDMDHSGMSSQEDEVFSDESLGARISRRERSFSSGTMSTKEQAHISPNSPYSSEPSTDMESYNQIAASRSSLDDSALQLAAERHDTFVPDEMCGYNTGSLRTRRSLKMQSLMELFEKNSGSNSSEDSSDAKWARSSDSTSESTTLSAGSQEKEPDTDDDIFNSCSRLSLSNQARCSRSRERGGRGLNKVSPLGTPAYKGEKVVLKNRKPSPLGDACMEVQHKGIKASTGTGTGRPPRYRGGSAPRAYINSDSSTSESDSHQQIDIGSYLKEPTVHRPARTTVWEMQETNPPEVKSGDLMGSSEDKSVQRRESIKELRQMFEKGAQNKEEDRDSGSETTLCTQIRLSPRTRSLSPAADNQEVQTAVMGVMRHSLELSNSAAGIRQGETPLMAQPLRLGPKPFYGSKN